MNGMKTVYEPSKAYLVEVKTTNSLNDTFKRVDDDGDIFYFDCVDGQTIVVTDDPRDIYEVFSEDTIISIKKLGPGYYVRKISTSE